MIQKPIETLIEDIKQITFTMGPISIHQFNQFAKVGKLNGLRILQYIRTKQGLQYSKQPQSNYKNWIKIDNKNLYELFGVSGPKKWIVLKKLEEAKLIEMQKRGSGKAPFVRIVCPTKLVN